MGNCLRSIDGHASVHVSSTSGTSASKTGKSDTTGTSNSAARSRSDFSEAATDRNDADLYPAGLVRDSPNLKDFTFAELKSATKNFSRVIGEGGFGKVYHGWVEEETLLPCKPGTGIAVAVKKLNPERGQGFDEWQSEVNFLGRLSHPNLVKLLGYCWESKEMLLVYEFMRRGSLENHLFRVRSPAESLSWETRIRISIGAGRGLSFLHSLEKQIIYRDFKPSNILLDANFTAKISDFGLAKLGPTGGITHLSTRVYGSHGYAAPEYVATGHLYVKSDVYGFGVLLLELMTGLRAFDSRRPAKQEMLAEWLKPVLSQKRKVLSMVDSRMAEQYPAKAVLLLAQLALKCLEDDPRARPSMADVVEQLEVLLTMKKER